MAGKITIRRVGNLLPHLCLAGVLLLVGIIVWLSTAGIPGCALRYIEQQASEAGFPVKLEKIQLQPSSGLAIKAEGINLSVPQQELPPGALRIRKIQVVFSLGRLLAGDCTPTQLQVKGASLNLPLGADETEQLKLEPLDLQVGFGTEWQSINATLSTYLHGVELKWNLSLREKDGLWQLFPEKQETSDTTTEPLAELSSLLAEYRPVLQQLKNQLDTQHWTAESHPKIQFTIRKGKYWRYGITAQVPHYELEPFHFRDAEIDAEFENNTLTVNTLRFLTINPDTRISLQAAYDLNTRELEFHTKSTAPLVKMLQSYLGEAPSGILSQIKSEGDSTPSIELDGRADFSDDYALNSITLRGKVEQNQMRLGQTQVNRAQLSFFIRDGSFNIDNLQLDFPEGTIKATSQAAEGKGFAKLLVNLPDETLLTLVRDFSNNAHLALPDGLSFGSNLRLQVDCDMQVAAFEPGKSRIEDLLPSLVGLELQFNTDQLSYGDTIFTGNSLSLKASGISYNTQEISIESISIGALSSFKRESDAAESVVFSAELSHLQTAPERNTHRIGSARLQVSADAATTEKAAVEKLHGTAELAELVLADGQARSGAIKARLQAENIAIEDTSAQGIHLDIHIPEGLNLADAWHNMQKAARVEASVQEIRHNGHFCATGTQLTLENTRQNEGKLQLRSLLGKEELSLSLLAALENNGLLHLNDINAHLPLASLLPLLGEEPLKELRLPRLLEAQGRALVDTKNHTLLNTHYNIQVPELVRVCNNVHVFKGREIPLALHVQGLFRTEPDGHMFYEADVDARHELGRLQVRVAGDPLRECRITGSNSIPVNIINALIDNVDAHWIMRDFRCTPGITRNYITDINTTIRYDRGIYVHALCKAELINMEFMLGALRDKEDAQGNPTGEEYLRTDLSPNPFSLVKEGHCDVEVLVQLDCVDENGQALPERIRINLLNPDMLYDNTPWLKRMGFKTGAPTSRITGEAVRFNIEDCTITLHKLKGNCYPAYSIGMYYAPIQHYMEDIILRDPVDIETEYCLFPIASRCEVPMQGIIRAEAPTGAGFRFLGTTIPFTNFSGFINISDADIYLDRMNAECWGGVMNGAVRIGFAGEHTTLDGYIQARTMNLKDIVASYGQEFTPATCSGFIRFQAPQPDLEAVQAYGRVSLRDGDLMQIGLFRPVGSLLADMPGYLAKLQESVTFSTEKTETPPTWADKFIRYVFDTSSNAVDSLYDIPFANHFLRYGIDEAFTKFDIRNGHLITRDMTARGYNLDIRTQLDIDLNKLTLTGDLWPRISSVPTVIISPVTILSKFLIDINLYGDVLNPQWEIGLSKKLTNEAGSLTPAPQVPPAPDTPDK